MRIAARQGLAGPVQQCVLSGSARLVHAGAPGVDVMSSVYRKVAAPGQGAGRAEPVTGGGGVAVTTGPPAQAAMRLDRKRAT